MQKVAKKLPSIICRSLVRNYCMSAQIAIRIMEGYITERVY
jgi:hypothetical protein